MSILMLAILATACVEDDCTTEREVFSYEPIYMTKDELTNRAVDVKEARALKNPGKVYYIGNTLFISDTGEGVHIIDNTDKSNPQPLAFLEIPGNVDVSFSGNHLIADSYLDILLIDISDVMNPVVVSTIDDLQNGRYYFDESKQAYVVGYNQEPTVRKLPCNHPFFERDYDYYYTDYSIYSFESTVDFDSGFSNVSNGSGGSPGIAGSNSSFAIVGDYFYFIEYKDVNVYDISNKTRPIFVNGFEVAWNIETLFPYEDKLFIGGQNGMYIYDNSDPTSPSYLSEFVHARACDPVFVRGTTAYVTLSEGTACQNFTNQLDVIDISDITDPKLIKSYDMYKPKGLSLYENTLIVCEEKAGLKIFDAEDKLAIGDNKLSSIQGYTFIEVIHLSPTEIMAIGPDGIFQYDVTDPSNPVLLSQMTIEP